MMKIFLLATLIPTIVLSQEHHHHVQQDHQDHHHEQQQRDHHHEEGLRDKRSYYGESSSDFCPKDCLCLSEIQVKHFLLEKIF